MTDRDDLLTLIKDLAVVPGPVRLSSGHQADFYIDLRRLTLHHIGGSLVGRVMLDLVADMNFDAVGGLTLGADPVAFAMMHEAPTRQRVVDAFVVRKNEKTHGLARRVEGPDVAGRRVLVVEDTSTTGASALAAADALRRNDAEVVGIAAIVDRGAGGAIDAAGLEYRSAFSLADLGQPG